MPITAGGSVQTICDELVTAAMAIPADTALAVAVLMRIFPFQNCEHVSVYVMFNVRMCTYVYVLLQICTVMSEHVGKKSQTMWLYSTVGMPGTNERFQLI